MSLSNLRAKEPPPDRVGQVVLESFRLLRELGAGSFATAYLAQQEGTERQAVVKVAHAHLMRGRHAEVIASRFAAEFKASTRVHHPHLVTAFTAGKTADGIPAIAMEYIPGMLLRDVLKQKAPLRLSRALRLMQQLVDAVSALHDVRVVHRDISPSNIMVTRNAGTQKVQLKLLDFGIAKLDNEDGKTMGPIGTPRYLAPEQFFGQAFPSSDIYSLGAIFWWMLTGEEHLERPLQAGVPFGRLMGQPFLADPRHINPEVPLEVAELCVGMLHHNPNDRPSISSLKERIPRMRRRLRSQQRGEVTGEITGMLVLDPYNTVPPGAQRQNSLGGYSLGGQSLGGQSLGGQNLQEISLGGGSQYPDLFSQAEGRRAVPPPIPGTRPQRPQTQPQVAAPPSLPDLDLDDRSPTERFIGDMPEWLAQLEVLVEIQDLGGVSRLSREMIKASNEVQAKHMRRLCTMVLHLSQEGMMEQVQGLCDELQREYSKCFPTMLKRLHQTHAPLQEVER